MTFIPWDDRQKDFANYFNPAYLGMIIYYLTKSYNLTNGSMSVALAFPGVTMVLHPEIRESFPRTIATRFSNWLRSNPELAANLKFSTQLLVPQVKEALLTSLRSDWIFTENGRLVTGAKAPSTFKRYQFYEADKKAAIFMGRWLASTGEDRDIFQKIGARP